MDTRSNMKMVVRAEQEFERIVMCEVIVPETPNVYGDYWTKEGIREFAYRFMEQGYGIDIDHDDIDRTGKVAVVEAFIARDDDPVFIPGSWVVGMRIHDDDIWADILDGKINGYSYEAMLSLVDAVFTYMEPGTRTGVTEPDLMDGHTHEFVVIVDDVGRAVQGGTSETYGHSHMISGATVTDEADGHVHRFNIVKGVGGI